MRHGLFIDDNSPVYVNEEGEWVTNLAYSHPLGNPFEDSHEGANFGNFSNYEGIDDAAEVFGNEDEFKSGGNDSCHDLLSTIYLVDSMIQTITNLIQTS